MAKKMIKEDYSGLPVELWREVFSELDTVSQTRLRIVCSTWNMLMDSPALSALIVLERRCVPCKRFPCEHFHPLLSAALFKRLRPGTRHVALVDGEGTMTPNDLLNMSDMLLYTAKHRPEIRLTALHLIGWQISFLVNRATDHCEEPSPCVQHNPDPWSAGTYRPRLVREHCRLQDFIKIFSSLPCESPRLVNCTVKWFCPFDDHRSRPQKRGPALEMEFPEVCLNVTKDFGCMLWEACEIMLPALSDEDLQQLMQWVTGLADPDLDDDEEEELNVSVVVCKVLRATQSNDPRSSSHYRGKHWCYEGLEGLQLEKLSRIALLFLWQLALPSEKGWRYG
ncbi:uncharacterized protein LOC129589672 [Paramacrobiotus metropolitanus]|uniref:uncharacterized protein LOC129589672 n=1 Tax=Paramacrobiotus metropolitanus TaxID=2943436 RepID=UPI00244572BE|nr:uncharacterized protein LOC129589672 [Paramacrobiotus metropolitanus]